METSEEWQERRYLDLDLDPAAEVEAAEEEAENDAA